MPLKLTLACLRLTRRVKRFCYIPGTPFQPCRYCVKASGTACPWRVISGLKLRSPAVRHNFARRELSFWRPQVLWITLSPHNKLLLRGQSRRSALFTHVYLKATSLCFDQKRVGGILLHVLKTGLRIDEREDIIQSEINQSQKDRWCVIPLIWDPYSSQSHKHTAEWRSAGEGGEEGMGITVWCVQGFSLETRKGSGGGQWSWSHNSEKGLTGLYAETLLKW